MNHSGYHWTIQPFGEAWAWEVREPHGGLQVSTGAAPSRAIAAALVVRALASGMTDRPCGLPG